MSAAVAVSGGDSERTRSQKSWSCVALFRLSCLVFRKTYSSSPSSATSPLSSTSSSSLKCFILLLPPYCLWPLAGIIFLHQDLASVKFICLCSFFLLMLFVFVFSGKINRSLVFFAFLLHVLVRLKNACILKQKCMHFKKKFLPSENLASGVQRHKSRIWS